MATVLTLVPALAQPWASQLFPQINGKYTIQTVHFAGTDWTLDDFSYAGYALGAKPLGPAVCNVVNVATSGDFSTALQSAIDSVGNSPGGGTVRIPAGSFTMTQQVDIPHSNVSIEGAGSGQTLINVTANFTTGDDRHDGLFTFGKSHTQNNQDWIDKGPILASVPTIIHKGDMFVDTSDASQINTNDWIVVQQYFWQALVDANSMDPNKWPANSTVGSSYFSFSYLRQVTGKSGNRVFLDAPIPWALDPSNIAINIRSAGGNMKENVGLKGVSIHFDNQNPVPPARTHGTAVYFEGVRNGWAYDVKVLNFPRVGIHARSSARITFLDCWIQGTQDYGGGGYGYGYLIFGAQNVLVKRCHGEDTRHNFISSRALTSMLVETQNVSLNERDPDDTHFGFEQSILWDRHTQMSGSALEALNRGCDSGGAYETLAYGVIWNFSGDGFKPSNGVPAQSGEIHVKPSPNGQAIVIGANGHHVFDNSNIVYPPPMVNNPCPPGSFKKGDPVPASAGLQVGSGSSALKNVLYEGVGQSGLQPGSLFETQLANRLGIPPADWIDPCAQAPVINPNGVTSAASFLPGPVAPGEIVTFFGSGMGPATLAGLQFDNSGLVATSLSGTRVLFDGNLAPIIYTQANQVSAVVPYAVAGKSSVQAQIEYQGQRSSGVTLSVGAAAPGIFTLNASGAGPGAILNQDNTVNSTANPALKGSIVVLYATGEGQTNPAGVDGKPAAPPLPMPQLPVAVMIGGVVADVQYAGAAPGLVAGALQINARVPNGSPSGDAVAVQVMIGSANSQPGVTLAVK